MTKPSDHFAAFVSPVLGSLVRRYGTGENLGQIAGTPNVDPALVIPLTHDEWRRHQNEYRRAIAEGSLVLRKAADWEKVEADAHKAALDADATMKAAQKKAAEEVTAAARKAEGIEAPSAEMLTTKKGSDR